MAVAYLVSRQSVGGVRQSRGAAQGIAQGDVDQRVVVRSRDEIGAMATAFGEMIAYLREMAGAAERIAEGDLTADVTARSERDALGTSFAASAQSLAGTAHELNELVGHCRLAA